MAKPRSHSAAFRNTLRLFALFGEPIRVVIFQRLFRKPSSAGDLARELPISRTAVVQHLKRLENAGLVTAESAGRRMIYRTTPAGLLPLSKWLAAWRAQGLSAPPNICAAPRAQAHFLQSNPLFWLVDNRASDGTAPAIGSRTGPAKRARPAKEHA